MSTSNIADVIRFLDGFVDSIDFRRPGVEGSLGRDCAFRVVEGIQSRADNDRRGIGEPWAENEPKYARWKAKRYNMGENEPNMRTGQMLSQKSLRGRTKVESKEVMMIYGVDAPPDKTLTGVEPSKADKKITDVKKAYFAHTGQSKRKIIRPFYEAGESDGKAVAELCQADVNRLIRETNAANGY